MTESLSPRVLGRMVSLFLTGTGGLIMGLLILSVVRPGLVPKDMNETAMLALATAMFLFGALWWWLPWDRWPSPVGIVILPVAMVLIATAQFAMPSAALLMGIFYVVVIAFMGLLQGQLWPSSLLPLTALAYVTPPLIWSDIEGGVVLIGVSLTAVSSSLGGEMLAWMGVKLREAHAVEELRMIDMQELLEASTSLSHQIDPKRAADLVAELGATLLHADRAAVFLYDAHGALVGAGSWNWPVDLASAHSADEEPSVPPDGVLADTAMLDALREGRIAVNGGGTLVLPLKGTGGTVGAVTVVSESGPFKIDGFTQGMGQTFATQAGLAFERVWATESLRDASLRDELTGLGNRRHAAAILARLQVGDAVVMIDLDHFKRVNDELGHPAGDDVLRSVGSYLGETLRERDLAARYGGEEFLVVLRDVRGAALVTVERLVEGWRATAPVTTFSAGVAVHVAGQNPADTLAKADVALYQAKDLGRDRVCVYEEDLADDQMRRTN